MSDFHVYDTTMRDGAQQEGLNLSVQDKLHIARHLDDLGVGYIEGGWPGSNPKDTEFFALAAKELDLKHATLAAFGATRRPDGVAASDGLVAALRESGASVVTLVAKSHDKHVELALRTTLEENLAMVRDTVEHLRAEGQRVFVDCEHFFNGYLENRDYALEVVRTAADAGAEVVVLCDTNGGMLPHQVGEIVSDVMATGARLGIHAHNDTGCAVANSMAAVLSGATHLQGCINGYGERTGNADLITSVANLELKLGLPVLPEGRLADATRIAHAIAEITNYPPSARQPYTGVSSFAHKAGLHASAIRVDPNLYQHVDPALVGNDMRLLVSEMAGRATIELKGKELGYDLADDPERLARLTDRVKAMEQQGYTFEAADASFELLLAEELGTRHSYFDIESWRVLAESPSPAVTDGAVLGGHGEAASRWSAPRRHRRGQRTGQRARPCVAAGDREAVPRRRPVPPHRLPRAHPRPGSRHRRGDARADRDHGRQELLGHRGRGRQHHRGVLGGVARRADVRSEAA